VRELKERIDQLKTEEVEVTRKGDFERAGKIKYGEIPQLEQQVAKLSAAMDGKQSRMLKEEVDEEDVAKIVSKWTGIPVSKMLEGEVKKLVRWKSA
jgi:ATP-dependent Clp protease ATP-binding subunit ClpB